MTRTAIAAIVGVVGLGLAPVAADDPIDLDVIVTDAQSRAITDLKPADFELLDSGQPRPVETARLHTGGGRVLGIFLDDFHVSAGEATARAQTALIDFVNDLRDEDMVAVVKPLDPLHAITFTHDREVIRQAVSTFDGRRGDYAPRTDFERNFLSRDPKTAAATRAQVVSAAIQALARRIGEQQAGRKAIVLVSEGFIPPQPRALMYAANRAGVAVYPIDSLREANDDEPMLRAIAEQTGGRASINEATLGPGFKQALAELDAYYVVTFRASDAGESRFHPVQIRVKRSGAQARVRSGYWTAAPSRPTASTSASRPTLPFRPSHSSPYIRPWIGMARGSDGLTNVTVTWEQGAAPPRNQRVASVSVKAMAADGRVLFEDRVGAGQRNRATFDAPPGFVALELAIHSSSGAALDTDYRGVSVPNLQVTKPTLATPQVLRTRTARSFAEASEDPDAMPVASRVFSRTERLLIRIPAYGAVDSAPTVSARLLNRRGTPMRDLPIVDAALPPGFVQFDLPLASLAPDEYRIEVTAANPRGARDEARDIVTFRVTN